MIRHCRLKDRVALAADRVDLDISDKTMNVIDICRMMIIRDSGREGLSDMGRPKIGTYVKASAQRISHTRRSRSRVVQAQRRGDAAIG